MNKPSPTAMELAMEAQKIFHRNADTMVAAYLIRHPDTDPADLMLVFQPSVNGVQFFLEPKEMHVPPVMPTDNVPNEHMESAHTCVAYADGWNDCRQAMIAQAKVFAAPEKEADHG